MVLFGKTVGISRKKTSVDDGVQQHASWQKKFGYGSALALTFFVVPLAVQAVSGTLSENDGESSASPAPNTGQVMADQTEDDSAAGDSPAAAPTTTDVQAHSSTNADGTTSTNVSVNGQNIPVPQNGSIQKKIISDDGTTSVNVQVNNGNSGSTSSSVHSNTSININSNTSSSDGQNNRGVGTNRR